MQKLLSNTFTYGLALLGFLTLCILGAEPSGTGDEALARYESACEFWAPIVLWSWCGLFVIVIASAVGLSLIEKK